MVEEKLMEFWENKRIEDEKRLKQYEDCENIKSKFLQNQIKEVKAVWHLDKKDIDFTLQPDKLNAELIADYILIESVKTDVLIKSLQNKDAYLKNKLFSDIWDEYNILHIIHCWLNNQPLIPPTIMFNKNLGECMAVDGKHRLNVAYHFGHEFLPIIIPKTNYDEVKKKLDL
ncbi:hypothetical protein [Fluviicola taffensis]|uniref:hypothetical protein n=1 Tax=Fluviicola taffensis TaxID=191579 RepID=UPI003138362F